MARLVPTHGGTDSLPEPRFDFSTNANPAGACPTVLKAVRAADLTRYPDPSYADLRESLAGHHQVGADRIVVGSGASELIFRLVQRHPGDVLQLGPTFSEYSRCAQIAGRQTISVRTPEAFLRAQRQRPGIAFVCWPNNPTGDSWPAEFIAAAAASGPLVIDLAYAPLCSPGLSLPIEIAGKRAHRLYSPNKSFGVTGIRGAYLITPRIDRKLGLIAPSWVIGRDAQAMLMASIQPRAQKWLSTSIKQVANWRTTLANALEERQLSVRESPATFMLAEVRDAARIARTLRAEGIRVRDATSFGLRRWIRLSAQPPVAQHALLAALDRHL